MFILTKNRNLTDRIRIHINDRNFYEDSVYVIFAELKVKNLI